MVATYRIPACHQPGINPCVGMQPQKESNGIPLALLKFVADLGKMHGHQIDTTAWEIRR